MKTKYWILIGVGVAGLATLGIVGYKKGWFGKKDDAGNSGSDSSNSGSSSSSTTSSTPSASNPVPSGTPPELINALKNLNNAVTKYNNTKSNTDRLMVNGFLGGIKDMGYTLVKDSNGYYKIA